jgi:hypothetical protein
MLLISKGRQSSGLTGLKRAAENQHGRSLWKGSLFDLVVQHMKMWMSS